MAVPLERPHAELRRGGETFTVMLLGSIEVRRIALRPRLAAKPVGIRFSAAEQTLPSSRQLLLILHALGRRFHVEIPLVLRGPPRWTTSDIPPSTVPPGEQPNRADAKQSQREGRWGRNT